MYILIGLNLDNLKMNGAEHKVAPMSNREINQEISGKNNVKFNKVPSPPNGLI